MNNARAEFDALQERLISTWRVQLFKHGLTLGSKGVQVPCCTYSRLDTEGLVLVTAELESVQE